MMYSIEFLDTVNIYRLCVRKELGEAGWSTNYMYTQHIYFKCLNMTCIAVNY